MNCNRYKGGISCYLDYLFWLNLMLNSWDEYFAFRDHVVMDANFALLFWADLSSGAALCFSLEWLDGIRLRPDLNQTHREASVLSRELTHITRAGMERPPPS